MEESVSLTPSRCKAVADRLRRVDVAIEDVPVVMDAAVALDEAGQEIARLARNRDRLMRNRNNWKRRALCPQEAVGV